MNRRDEERKGEENWERRKGKRQGEGKKLKSNMNHKGREISEGGGKKGKRKSYLPMLCSVQCAQPISVQLVANFFILFYQL